MAVDSEPDRPIPAVLRGARRLLRSLRIVKTRLLLRGKFRVGSNVAIGRRAVLLPPDRLWIGDNVRIGSDFHLATNLEIDGDVLISSRVSIIGNDHEFDDPGKTIYWAGRLPATTVRLQGDNLIGFGTTVVGGVTIGRGCVVGAGSVVTRDLPEDTVCAGVPAKPIRPRRRES